MRWDELESERRHLTAADQDKLNLLQQVKDSVGTIAERVERLSEKMEQQSAHLPEWEVMTTEVGRECGDIGWEPFGVGPGGHIFWRRQVK